MSDENRKPNLLNEIADELAVQAWLAGAELRHPSLRTPEGRAAVEGLARLRDELRVQLHLGRLEAADEFTRIEGQWRKLKQVAAQAADDAGGAIDSLIADIRKGYQSIRSAAK